MGDLVFVALGHYKRQPHTYIHFVFGLFCENNEVAARFLCQNAGGDTEIGPAPPEKQCFHCKKHSPPPGCKGGWVGWLGGGGWVAGGLAGWVVVAGWLVGWLG